MGGTHIEAPKIDPAQTAYYNYMLQRQKKINDDTDAATLQQTTDLNAIKTAGTTGYNTFKANLENQYKAGILDINQVKQNLKDYEAQYKLGTGYTQEDINKFTTEDISAQEARNWTLAGQTYKDILGRTATEDELKSFSDLYKTGQYKLPDLVNTIKASDEYGKKHNESYLQAYYKTMYGDTTADVKDEKTGKVTTPGGKFTFKYDSSLDPTFSNVATGLTMPTPSTSFTGTPAEIEEFQQAQRQKRDFAYNAGLTALQGQIDKDVQKLKTAGSESVGRIAANAQVLSNLTQGFWS